MFSGFIGSSSVLYGVRIRSVWILVSQYSLIKSHNVENFLFPWDIDIAVFNLVVYRLLWFDVISGDARVVFIC